MTEPTKKTLIVEMLFTCQDCRCVWPDVVIEGCISYLHCPREDQEGHKKEYPIYVGAHEAHVAFVEPTISMKEGDV